ncbi:ATP-binding cassette domain-containing protein [Aristophania vespae]|uniref:ATP-binding cassette domain-containing protein n=1 Tax=Aristophania vespae TaxID=2697033 RepID=A0A6P1NI19_9PROT|nr:ATP-binding cassette domain-containing protein [Aristophania vespae]QHI96174.1 ATP-binding cassette domain-containing protein [Aristophania vespae]
MTTPRIRIRGLKKSFGPKVVLDGIDLDVQAGTSMVIIGGSGSGKSVLLRCILGIILPDEGTIEIDGEDILRASPMRQEELRRKIGMLFQNAALFDSMTVFDNILFGLKAKSSLHPRRDRHKLKQEALRLLSQVGLDESVAALSPSELSGGMQKRVGLARAIAGQPDILFFDEPTTGLDPIMGAIIDGLIVDCVKKLGSTAIAITHDMASAQRIGNQAAMLYKGKLIWQGLAQDLLHSNNDIVDQFTHGRKEGPINVETHPTL